jgi:hypothetical protein
VDRAHGSVDHGRMAVYGSMVDHGRRWAKGSPELAIGAAPVSGSSPVVGEKEKEASGVPTVGEGGRCGPGGRPATVEQNGSRLELGVGQVEARRGEAESGMRCGGCCSARGSFYMAGGWEGRQCGEGNDRRWSAPLMAFKSSVLGGERRGEWGVRRG